MGALLAIVSSVSWGSSDFVGGLLSKRIAPLRVVVCSQGSAFLVMCVLFGVRLATVGAPSGHAWLWGIAAGLANALGLACLYAGLSVGTMGVVSPIASLGVVVPVVMGLLTGDSFGLLVGLGLLLAMSGAVLAAGPEFSGRISRLPVVLAACAALGLGSSLYFVHLAAGQSVVPTLWLMRLVSVVELLVIWRLLPRAAAGASPASRDLPAIFLLGCGDLTATALFGLASQRTQVSLASVLASLYPVATLLLARFVLHERMRAVQTAGVGMALLGVVLVVS
ncbi:DMT family transporter [Flexivirga caeni]|nr:DMT family transporter [Flexivirga caeni]